MGAHIPKGAYVLAHCREDMDIDASRLRLARVCDRREVDGHVEYHLHFAGYNARLADWYPVDATTLVDEEKAQKEYPSEWGLLHNSDLPTPRNVETVVFGEFSMIPWYFSPVPKEFNKTGTLYVCEFCCNMMASERAYESHLRRCTCRRPPGDLIYKDDRVCFFEVNGCAQLNYCRNICLIARFFLQHKSLQTDTDIFYFYVLYAKTGLESGDDSYHFVGFFSKEKASHNNLSCIMTLPCFQKRGYGNLMIELSYIISARERRLGGPELPLSDLGAVTYMRYWRRKISEVLAKTSTNEISLLEISKKTMFTLENIREAMQYFNILVGDPVGKTAIHLPESVLTYLSDCFEYDEERNIHHLDPKYLHWAPSPMLSQPNQ
ncbi:Histone acetyltransferase MYST2 [Giardia muris]|uniref:Histone acetyltransferase n=1 Tax=Giardia muris TaxID=5742 RepID=A0A4Z1SXU4_GIAMU|nr:Histone acetyltransferase MYST2 [Giardia muris]|eukprot:TNJ29635.1 Histone acetyltransferase MYST2 [Giardia muris]